MLDPDRNQESKRAVGVENVVGGKGSFIKSLISHLDSLSFSPFFYSIPLPHLIVGMTPGMYVVKVMI